MNKSQSEEIVQKCAALQDAADDLAREGADRISIMAALVEVIAQIAYEERLVANELEAARLDKKLDQSRRALSDLWHNRRAVNRVTIANPVSVFAN